MTPFGSPDTRLIVLRGNSGSGKSSVARALRQAYGYGLAWVEQDYLRRILLREHDLPDAANIGLIEQTVRYALNHGFHVVLEGILYTDHYGGMLRGLQRDHVGTTRFYYFDLDFEETARRHTTRPQATEFSVDDMKPWFRACDTLNVPQEQIFDASLSLENVTGLILQNMGPERSNKITSL